jgi:hypothetical protein
VDKRKRDWKTWNTKVQIGKDQLADAKKRLTRAEDDVRSERRFSYADVTLEIF